MARQQLAGQEGQAPVAVKTIAERCSISLRFLQGIISDLAKAHLIVTFPGPHGGVALAKEPELVSILEVIEAVEGTISLMECFDHPGECGEHSHCSIMGVLHGAQNALITQLRRSNLKLMVAAQNDPFGIVPEGHYQKPQFGCPVLR